MTLEVLGDRKGVFAMTIHAQRQGFDSLKELPGILRRKAGSEVTQGHGAHAQNEGERSKRFGQVVPPTQAVVTAVRLVIKGEFPVFPIEGAGINHHASDPVAVATEPFGQGVNDDAGAVLDRSG